MSKNKAIMVYTDGACSNNPGGPGGWAATLNYDERYDVISGHSLETTNNRMELTAVVEAIKYLIKKQEKYFIIQSYIQCLKKKIQKCGILVILCYLIC